jgi:hypothetical protein
MIIMNDLDDVNLAQSVVKFQTQDMEREQEHIPQ